MFEIRSILISSAIALAVGFGTGYYTKGRFELAGQAQEVKLAQKNTAKNVLTSQSSSDQLEQHISTVTNQTDVLKNAALNIQRKRIEKECPNGAIYNNNNATPTTEELAGLGADSYRLSLGVVRMLNAAVEGRSLDSISKSDAESQSSSEVTGDSLLSHDFEVIKAYRELAEIHNELVDEVNQKLKKQAE